MNKININHTDALLVENRINEIHIKYPRPLRFSNPYKDFSIDELNRTFPSLGLYGAFGRSSPSALWGRVRLREQPQRLQQLNV